ncbi:MAG: cell division protein FtsZ, partial [Rikenellaceae bacterium]|nr:cell division protein FtsZ [Rikenellaceae bacterium]
MNDDIINSLRVERSKVSQSHIMVIGVGGGGGNAVNYMHKLGINDVDFMVCNTDQQALNISPVELKVRLGEDGLGAGNDPAMGRQAAIASLDLIKQVFENYSTKMVFIAAAMGGGTGTGAAPVVAKAAREMGILTVGIVTTPMRKEGPLRFQQAIEGVSELKASVDSLLIIDSDKIATLGSQMSLNQAYALPDNVLATAVKGIAEIITLASSRTNIDFADVKKAMTNSGRTHMGAGSAAGENRAEKAVNMALHSPLLDTKSIRGAKNILLNVNCKDSDSLIYSELMTILEVIQSEAKYVDENGQQCIANIVWGNSDKPELNDALEVVVVATGFVETPLKVVEPIKPEPQKETPKETQEEHKEETKVADEDTTDPVTESESSD